MSNEILNDFAAVTFTLQTSIIIFLGDNYRAKTIGQNAFFCVVFCRFLACARGARGVLTPEWWGVSKKSVNFNKCTIEVLEQVSS